MSQRFVMMGVSGCGKTAIGRALVEAVGGRFIDGDDRHPVANVAKMREGKPLDNAARLPLESRAATEAVLARFFSGRIHHHVTEAQ